MTHAQINGPTWTHSFIQMHTQATTEQALHDLRTEKEGTAQALTQAQQESRASKV